MLFFNSIVITLNYFQAFLSKSLFIALWFSFGKLFCFCFNILPILYDAMKICHEHFPVFFFYSEWSKVLKYFTNAGPPSSPQSPQLVDCGTNFIRLKWQEPETNGGRYLAKILFLCWVIDNALVYFNR